MPRRCPTCKSRKWHREPLSGLIVCSEGHVLQNYRSEADEGGEFSTAHGVKKRTLKSQRVKKEYITQADPKYYYGDRAEYLFYQCLQVLFRKQVAVLIKAWSLPQEFESICRDVWALHLCLLPHGPPAAPLDFELYGGPPPPTGAVRHYRKKRYDKDGKEIDDMENIVKGEAESESASSEEGEEEGEEEEEEEEDDEEDSQLAALMDNAPEESDEEDGARPRHEQRDERGRGPLRKGHEVRDLDDLDGNLAALVLSCWIMRLPILYGDIIQMIESYDLPYLAPLHHLPLSMTIHANNRLKNVITPRTAPKVKLLHAKTAALARQLRAKFEVVIPEYNAAPILWRAVRALNGSPTLYTAAKRLAATMDIPLGLQHEIRLRSPNPVPRYAPEIALMCCVVVTLKLMYGLDGQERRPKDLDDPLSSMPVYADWFATMKAKSAEVAHDIFKAPSEMGVLDMTDADTDQYLTFCHKALLDLREGVKSRDQDLKDDFFPLPPLAPSESSTRPSAPFPPYSTFTPTPLSTDRATLLPGQSTTIYTHTDISGLIHPSLEVVCAVAAAWAHVPQNEMEQCVHVFEKKVQRWWEEVSHEREKDIKEALGVKIIPEHLKPVYAP